jgi:hypothetical protein
MNLDMNEIITNVVMTKVCSIKADKDSDKSKNITLKVKFDGTKLSSVFDKALSGAVIQWQNGVGRKNFDTYKSNQVIEIQFNAPASRTAVDPISAVIAGAEAAGMTPEQYIIEQIKQRTAKA